MVSDFRREGYEDWSWSRCSWKGEGRLLGRPGGATQPRGDLRCQVYFLLQSDRNKTVKPRGQGGHSLRKAFQNVSRWPLHVHSLATPPCDRLKKQMLLFPDLLDNHCGTDLSRGRQIHSRANRRRTGVKNLGRQAFWAAGRLQKCVGPPA